MKKRFGKSPIHAFFSLHILFYILIIISIIPRISKLLSKDNYFDGDLAFSFFLTKSIFLDHIFTLVGMGVGTFGGFYQGAGWYYLLGIPFLITKGHPCSSIALMFIISILVLFIGSFFAFRYLGTIAGIFITFFLGVSPYLITYTNSPWPTSVIPLFGVLYGGFLFLYFSKSQEKYFLFTTISLGLMIHFEITSFAILFPSYIIVSCYLFYKKTLKPQSILKAIGIIVFIFLPHIIYDANHNYYNLKGIMAAFHFDREGDFFTNNMPQIIMDRYNLFKNNLLSDFPPNAQPKIMFFFLLYLLWGMYLFIKNKKTSQSKKLFSIYLFGTILMSYLCLIIYPLKKVPFWWTTYLTIFIIFLTGIIWEYLWSLKYILYKIVICFFIFLFAASALQEFSKSLVHEIGQTKIPYAIREQEAIEYIYNDSRNKSFKVLFITGESDVLKYKYLLWYIGKEKYKNSLGFQKSSFEFQNSSGRALPFNQIKQLKHLEKGLYYVIITQQSYKNGFAQKMFKYIPAHSLMSQKIIRNEFVVQKRYIN